MKNPPSLIELVSREAGTDREFKTIFKRIVQRLFIYDSNAKGYTYKPNPVFRRLDIDGIVKGGYPGVEGTVIFQFMGLKKSKNESVTHELEKIFHDVVKSKAVFNRYILVTPEDLTEEQKKKLSETRSKGYKLDLVHYGQTKLMELLIEAPALNKYFYGKFKFPAYDFNTLKQEYKDTLARQVEELGFIGLPTAQYQVSGGLEKVMLTDVYIPPTFHAGKNEKRTLEFSAIKTKYNRFVILGGPGAGKSTLAKYLALNLCKKNNENLKSTKDKIPFIISLCDFVWIAESESRQLDFVSYLSHHAKSRMFKDIEPDFFVAMLELGKAVVIFDGLDEVTSKSWRAEIAEKIKTFSENYPDSEVWVMSRSYGYRNIGGIDEKVFMHYHLSPVSRDQSEKYIERFYNIQLPREEDKAYRVKKINALKRIFETSPSMEWFREKPLFLTLLSILNLGEAVVPRNRAALYDNFLELTLWTWANRKFRANRATNPMAEKGIDYNEQLRLLGAIAAYMKNRSNINKDREADGFIPEDEILKIVLKEQYDRKRISEKIASENADAFFRYMVNQTGFLVAKGLSEDKEILFSFIHVSFIDYLYAYHVAQDRSKANHMHCEFLVDRLGKPEWEEIVLLSLLIFSEYKLPDFFALFSKAALEAINASGNPDAWTTMGRAVRDNIKFDDHTIRQILQELLKQWLKSSDRNGIAFTVMKEIVRFSKKGKSLLKDVIKDNISRSPAKEAFASLALAKHFNVIDDPIVSAVGQNPDREHLLSYLPVYRDTLNYESLLNRFINEHLKENHWITFYNSAREKPFENLDSIIEGQMNETESKGFIISSWTKIFDTYQKRQSFIDKNKPSLSSEKDFNYLNIGYENDKISNPLSLFHNFVELPLSVHLSRVEDDNFFKSEDRAAGLPVRVKQKYISSWATNLILKIFNQLSSKFPRVAPLIKIERKKIIEKAQEFGLMFGHDLIQYFNRPFCEDLQKYFFKMWKSNPDHNYLKLNFKEYLNDRYEEEFKESFTRWDFNRDFRQRLSRELSGRELGRCFGEASIGMSGETLTRFFWNYLREAEIPTPEGSKQHLTNDASLNLKKKFFDNYIRPELKKAKWDDLDESDFKMFHYLVIGRFEQPDETSMKIVELFYTCLYENLFIQDFELSLDRLSQSGRYSIDNIYAFPNIRFSINNPLLIPFTFNFIITMDLHHYFVKLLADLNNRFYKKPEPGWDTLSEAINEYISRNPIISYFVSHSWDLFCKRFYDQYQKNVHSHPLKLAGFIAEAAKISLVNDMPCVGDTWNGILVEAEKSKNHFVQLSLALYRVCNSTVTGTETSRLAEQLEAFKKEHPEYYNLIGLHGGTVFEKRQ